MSTHACLEVVKAPRRRWLLFGLAVLALSATVGCGKSSRGSRSYSARPAANAHGRPVVYGQGRPVVYQQPVRYGAPTYRPVRPPTPSYEQQARQREAAAAERMVNLQYELKVQQIRNEQAAWERQKREMDRRR
jgi:hypothetical protein